MARQGSYLGRENYENEEVVVNGDLMERPEDSVETQLIEVDNETRGADVLDIDEAQLAGDTEQLEEHAEVVADSLEDGGMDETAARQTEIAVESIANRWNLKRPKLGRESYASGSTRMSATKLGLESIMDTISSAWQRFYDWVVERFRAMKDIWRKYVNAGKAFKKRAQKLRDRINKLEGSPDKDEKISMKKIWKLAAGEKVSSTATAKFDGGKFVDQARSNLEASFDANEKIWELKADNSSGAIKNINNHISGEVMLPNLGRLSLNGSESKFNKLLPSDVDRGGKVKVFSYPGALAFVYHKSSQTSDRFKGVDGYDAFANTECLFYTQLRIEDVLDQEAPVLKVDEMHEYIDSVIGTASSLEKLIEKYSSVERKMDKLQNDLKRAIEKEGKAGGDTKEKQDKMKHTSMKVEIARIALNNAIQLDRLVQGTARNYCEGALTYVQESMRAYKD